MEDSLTMNNIPAVLVRLTNRVMNSDDNHSEVGRLRSRYREELSQTVTNTLNEVNVTSGVEPLSDNARESINYGSNFFVSILMMAYIFMTYVYYSILGSAQDLDVNFSTKDKKAEPYIEELD